MPENIRLLQFKLLHFFCDNAMSADIRFFEVPGFSIRRLIIAMAAFRTKYPLNNECMWYIGTSLSKKNGIWYPF
jgi:hypothetical protein